MHSEAPWVRCLVRKPFQIMVYTTVQRFADIQDVVQGAAGEMRERATSRVWVNVEVDIEEWADTDTDDREGS